MKRDTLGWEITPYLSLIIMLFVKFPEKTFSFCSCILFLTDFMWPFIIMFKYCLHMFKQEFISNLKINMILNQFKLETFIMSDYLVSVTNSDHHFDGLTEINIQIIDRYGSLSQDLTYSIDYFKSYQLRNIQYFFNRKEHFKMVKVRSRISQLKYFLYKIMRRYPICSLELFCIFRDNYISDFILKEDMKFIQIKRLKIIRKFQLPKKQKILNATIQANNTVILTQNHHLYIFLNKTGNKQKPFKINQQLKHLNQIFIVSQDQKLLFYGDYLALIQPFMFIFKKDCQFVQFSECSQYLALYTNNNVFQIFDLFLKKKTYEIYIPSWVKFDFMYYDFQSMKIIKENYERGERAVYKLIINEKIKTQIKDKHQQ